MAVRYEVKYISKTDLEDRHARIQFIGGLNIDGTCWKISQREAVDGIEFGLWSFYLEQNDHRIDVVVAVSDAGDKYIKTEHDGNQSEILLDLPEFP